jgi:hypothetical protein
MYKIMTQEYLRNHFESEENPKVLDISFDTRQDAENWLVSKGFTKDPLFHWYNSKTEMALVFDTREDIE